MAESPTDIIRTHYRPQRAATQHLLDRRGFQSFACFILMPFTAGMLGGITIAIVTHWI